MTQLSKNWLAVASVAGILSFFCPADLVGRALAQDLSHRGPSQMRVELENPSMIVLRVVLGPHEKTGVHDVSPRLVIWLTDAHLRDTMADGTQHDYQRAAGTVEWIPAQRHAGENLSDRPIEFLAVVPAADNHGHR
jgi:beta-alanine degradation protein BauB